MRAGALLDFVLATIAFVGHFALAVWIYNRLHALAWPRLLLGVLEKLLLLIAAGVLVVYFSRWWLHGQVIYRDGSPIADVWLWWLYPAIAGLLAATVIPLWLWPKLRAQPPTALTASSVRSVDIEARLGHRPIAGLRASLAAAIPGNEIFQLTIAHKTLAFAQLPGALDGLTIAHLSDLHMTGKLTVDFYNEVVDETNALGADLIVITGDIAEQPQCLDWIEPTLGRLRAPQGVYFVLGNHEMRLGDVRPLRNRLTAVGLTDMGSRAALIEAGRGRLLLAGLELPWFGSYPFVEPFAREDAFRVLLSHTPDQLGWAKRQGFDLMLAGHNHGGQIRLPYLGALITPSRYGFRYAGGLYYEAPTLLHVSRGIAGLHSVRFNCPPELALLKLVRMN